MLLEPSTGISNTTSTITSNASKYNPFNLDNIKSTLVLLFEYMDILQKDPYIASLKRHDPDFLIVNGLKKLVDLFQFNCGTELSDACKISLFSYLEDDLKRDLNKIIRRPICFSKFIDMFINGELDQDFFHEIQELLASPIERSFFVLKRDAHDSEQICNVCFEPMVDVLSCLGCRNVLCFDCSIRVSKCPYCRFTDETNDEYSYDTTNNSGVAMEDVD